MISKSKEILKLLLKYKNLDEEEIKLIWFSHKKEIKKKIKFLKILLKNKNYEKLIEYNIDLIC